MSPNYCEQIPNSHTMLRPRLARLLARSLSMTPQQVPPVLDSAAKPAAQAHVPAPAPAEITQTESAHHPPPPVDRPATPSQGSPMMGPPIHDEMAAYPATWSTPLRIAINSIRTIIELGKNSVYRARLLTANAVTPYPVLSVTITPVTIVRRSDLVLEGMSAEEAKGSFEAEWVEHRSVARRRTTKKKGSEKSPVELTTETPTETVVLPQGPWGDVESEIAVTNGNVENGAGESSRAVKTEPQEDSLLRRFTKWSGVGSESEGKVPEPPKIMDAPEHERVILYIHGGAFVIGSRKLHRGITWMLSKYGGGASVLSIDYRLSPPSCFPLPLQDCLSAYLHLIAPQVSSSIPESREGISDGGKVVMRYKPSQIVLMGDSAGGNLCLATVLYLREHGKKLREQYGIEAKNIMPAGVGGLSPWCDLSHSQPSFLLNGEYDIVPFASADPKYIDTSRNHYYIKDNTFLRDPLVSPMYAHVDDSDKGESGELLPLPPILLHCGTSERLYHEILFFGRSTLEKSASPVYLEVYEDMEFN
ncbi:Alpha/Beta hydrolase protein [Cladochytrium replicatum]|nr:Alpha/Beta hydrolase protein [Cladochytrium replicatum]